MYKLEGREFRPDNVVRKLKGLQGTRCDKGIYQDLTLLPLGGANSQIANNPPGSPGCHIRA